MLFGTRHSNHTRLSFQCMAVSFPVGPQSPMEEQLSLSAPVTTLDKYFFCA